MYKPSSQWFQSCSMFMEKTTVKSLLFGCKHKTCFWKLGNFKRGGANVCVVGYLSGQAGLSFSRLVLAVLKKLNLCSSARSLHLPLSSLSHPITCHLFHAPWGCRVIATRLQKIDLVCCRSCPSSCTWTGWTHEIGKIESDDHSPCSSEPYVQSSYKLGCFAWEPTKLSCSQLV